MLHDLEAAYAIASKTDGIVFPQAAVDEIWKEVLLYQFHDILPGSCIKRVYDETEEAYCRLEQSVKALLDKLVVKEKLDAGFAFDGDADRCLCVDNKGNLVDGDFILAICSLDMKARGQLKNNTVVGTIMTNFGFTKFCRDSDINFIPTKVGDRYVLEEMNLGDYKLGGEQSGHIIFRDFATTGDGQLTALQVLSLMARSKKTLSELASVMERAPQELINLKVSADGKLRFYTDPDIKAVIKKAEADLSETGRLVVRPSGTEPLIRVMTEGSDRELIVKVAHEVADAIMKALG